MPGIEAVIFDLDGTLVDTSAGIFDTARYTMRELGLNPEVPMERMRRFIGPPLEECFRTVYNLDDSLIARACPIYRKRYHERGQYLGAVYDGMPEVLRRLRKQGFLLGVATLKNERVARSLLVHFGLAGFFSSIHGDLEEGGRSKADVLGLVLRDFSLPADQAVLVGDTGHDERGAEEARMPFVAVRYGFGFDRTKTAGGNVLAVIDRPEELADPSFPWYAGKEKRSRIMKQRIESNHAPAAIGPYSQAVSVGNLVFLSGQMGADPATGALADGIEAQTAQTLANLKSVLQAAGLGLDAVVKTTVFLKDMGDFAAMNKVYQANFGGVFPARSAVQVAKLPKEAALVEIEAIASLA